MLHHRFQDRKLKLRPHCPVREEVIAPWGISEKCRGIRQKILALCGDFRSHSAAGCKEFNTGHPEQSKMLKSVIMKGGLAPSGKPLNKVVNNVFKSFHCEVYDVWALTSPINPTTVAPLPHTCQKVASWFVQAWDRITEEICTNAWNSCGYKKNK